MTLNALTRAAFAVLALALSFGNAVAADLQASNAAGVMTALAKAQGGDRILLAPGNYSSLILSKFQFAAPGVTIAPADPKFPPTISGVETNGVAGVTFRDLVGTISTRTLNAYTITSSDRVWVIGGQITDPTRSGKGGAVAFRFAHNSGVEGVDVSWTTGLRCLQSDHITFRKNVVHDNYSDGVQCAASQFVTVDANRFFNFIVAPLAHPDVVQFFTASTTVPSTDLTITDNTFERGTGAMPQCIFGSAEAAGIRYARVVIKGNACTGSMFNGIVWDSADDIAISNNFIQGWDEPALGTNNSKNSWIKVIRSTAVSSFANTATSYQSQAIAPGNAVIVPAKPGDTSAWLAWLAGNAPVPPPPVVTPPPPAGDPRDTEITLLTAQLSAANAALASANAALSTAQTDLITLTSERDSLQALLTTASDAVKARDALVANRQALLDQIAILTTQITALAHQ